MYELQEVANPWFTVECVDSGTYAISEYGHWENAHSYLLIGAERAALIDSGLGIGDLSAVVRELTELSVVVLTTHAHWDHTGGHGGFDDIRVHADDADWLRNGLPIPSDSLRRNLVRQPFTSPPPASFDPDCWEPFRGEPSALLGHGEAINLGGRTLQVHHTPGHSPGHVCFHEAAAGLLFTGDLVYCGCLYASYPSTNPEAFARSVQYVADLPAVQRLLPGHHELTNLCPDVLSRLADRLEELRCRGDLRHGTGLHTFPEIAISIRF